MEEEIKAHLRSLADTYSAATGTSFTSVLRLCSRDGSLMARLSGGKSITLRRVDEIRQWFSDHWPVGVAWPESAWPRPEPRPVENPSIAVAS